MRSFSATRTKAPGHSAWREPLALPLPMLRCVHGPLALPRGVVLCHKATIQTRSLSRKLGNGSQGGAAR